MIEKIRKSYDLNEGLTRKTTEDGNNRARSTQGGIKIH
jgi:hypothetical protein